MFFQAAHDHIWLDPTGSAASRTPEIISPLSVSCCSMTHLALMLPVAALFVSTSTDLNETATEEALGLDEMNGNQTTHNPSAVGHGEPIILSVSITTDDGDTPSF